MRTQSEGGRPDRPTLRAKAEYDGRVRRSRACATAPPAISASGRFRREPTWAHDFPRADFNFLKILGELTFVPSFVDQGNVLTLDDPDLAKFPIAYMSEPGFWTMSDAETAGLRNYLLKGGFIIFDDFRGNHIQNLCRADAAGLPGGRFQQARCDAPDVSFVFRNQRPRSAVRLLRGRPATPNGWGIFEDNDPRKRLIAIANNNHDLGELWEFSDTGYVPVDLSNEAYKFGVNYVMYAMTH